MTESVTAVVRRDRSTSRSRRLALLAVALGLCVFALIVFIVALGSALATVVATAALVLGVAVGVVASAAAVRDRLDRAAASERMLQLASPLDSSALREALSTELGDPTMRILFRKHDSPGLVDQDGAETSPLRAPGRRRFGLLDDAQGPSVFVEVETVDRCTPSKRAAALAAATLALEHARLQTLLQQQLIEMRSSRRRLVRAALEERRELEGRLHDGAQSTLFAAMAEIGRVRSKTTDEPILEAVEDSSRSLTRAVEELRRLVKGRIFPSALREAGLAAAVEVATEEFPVAVDVEVQDGDDRADEATEIAAYLTIVDLLGEILRDPTIERLSVRLRCTQGVLCAEIGYRGDWLATFPDAADDRVRALGGTMERLNGRGVLIRIPCVE